MVGNCVRRGSRALGGSGGGSGGARIGVTTVVYVRIGVNIIVIAGASPPIRCALSFSSPVAPVITRPQDHLVGMSQRNRVLRSAPSIHGMAGGHYSVASTITLPELGAPPTGTSSEEEEEG